MRLITPPVLGSSVGQLELINICLCSIFEWPFKSILTCWSGAYYAVVMDDLHHFRYGISKGKPYTIPDRSLTDNIVGRFL